MAIKTEQIACGPSAAPEPPALWSVRSYLGWLLVACLVPGIVGAVVLFLDEYREGRVQLEKDTIQTARAMVQAVDAQLFKAQIAAQSLSTAGSLAKRNFPDFHRRARALLSATQAGSNFVLSNESGAQIVNTFKDYGIPLPRHGNPAVLRRVFETGKPVISDIFIGGVTQRPLMSVDVPVVIDGKVAYALSIGLQPGDFNGILSTQRLPADWVAAIFDTTGTLVARTHNADQFVGQKGSADFIALFNTAREGSLEGNTREGIPVVSVFSRSDLTGWTVGIGIPRQALQADLLRKLATLAAGIIALFAFGAGLAWVIGNRIAVSVRTLRLPAIALGAGEPMTVPRVHLKEAAEVLGAMGEAADLLEQRTTALQTTYQSLLAREKDLADAHRLSKFGTWHWNLESGEIAVSQEISHIYGRELPPFPEQRGTLLTVESWERLNSAVQETMRTGVGYDLELQARHADGAPIWVHTCFEAIRAPGGDVAALRGTMQDITERKATEMALFDSQTRFRATFEQAAVGMAHVSLDGQWLNANDKICDIVGCPREALFALSFRDIAYGPDQDKDSVQLQQLLTGAIPSYSMEKRCVRRDGTLIWINLTVTLVRTPAGAPDYFVCVIEDIESRKETETALDEARRAYRHHLEQQVAERTKALMEANQELDRRAHHDALTQLPNRLAANDRLRFEFLRLKRTGTPYSVLMMDIDHFKAINDTYGHEAGDNVLKHFAATLAGTIRATDFVARFGGEEFLAVMPDTDIDGAMASAEKIRRTIYDAGFPVVGQVSLSIGVGLARAADANEDEAVRRADAALYRAKNEGRNTVRA